MSIDIQAGNFCAVAHRIIYRNSLSMGNISCMSLQACIASSSFEAL